MFLLGTGLFTLASAACAVAPGLWWLVAFRVLQAAGAAALTPTSLGLLLAAVPAGKRLAYVRIWSAVAAIAAAAGPVLGGLLVAADWRWRSSRAAPGAGAAAAPSAPSSRRPCCWPGSGGAPSTTRSRWSIRSCTG